MTLVATRPYAELEVSDRIWRRIAKSAGADDCWLFDKADSDGYARAKVAGYSVLVHRLIYVAMKGPIPNDLSLDHLCRVRHCVNPAHLEPVPLAENVRRGDAGKYQRDKTHCRNGHEYNEANTYHHDGRRHCRPCNSAAARRYKERKAAR